jgi:hypothetical protein
LPERVNRFAPAGDAEKPQKQAVSRNSAAYQYRENHGLGEAM